MLAALDLATGRMSTGSARANGGGSSRRSSRVSAPAGPGEKLYVIADNYSRTGRPEVRSWTAGNQVELVFLSAYGSWLNWIESEFAALRYVALKGTDHRSHAEQNAAIAGYVRHHNKQAQKLRPAAGKGRPGYHR
jgi:hypothetical protein